MSLEVGLLVHLSGPCESFENELAAFSLSNGHAAALYRIGQSGNVVEQMACRKGFGTAYATIIAGDIFVEFSTNNFRLKWKICSTSG